VLFVGPATEVAALQLVTDDLRAAQNVSELTLSTGDARSVEVSVATAS
jgi:hypothetical protein